jgi:hypothetical protein
LAALSISFCAILFLILVSKLALAAYHASKYADSVPLFIALDTFLVMFTVFTKYVYKFLYAVSSSEYTFEFYNFNVCANV